jgi:hypothetical protein
MKIKWERIEEKSSQDYEDDRVVWRCYSCGIDSDKGSFRQEITHTYCGTEYDCVCNTCESEYTFQWGEGEPICEECGNIGWYCGDCSKTMCDECWNWFNTPEGEPEEYLCRDCSGYE